MGTKQRNRRGEGGKLTFEALEDSPWQEELKLAAEAHAGTVVSFDSRTPHLSGPNRSEKSRHAYTLHLIDRDCLYPVENWLQRSSELPLRGFNT